MTKTKPNLKDLTKSIDEIATKYHEMNWFSGSVLIARDGAILFEKSYGYANKEAKRRNKSATRFNLGSIMKNFTKVLVLQQVVNGKLSPDDTIDRFELGFVKEISTQITINHLLNHRSGFADIFTAEYREDQMSFDTLDKKLHLLIDKPLIFEPGTDRRYSNYGYIVLGAILEKLTKKSFEELLQKNIFNRIGLSNSSFRVNASDANQSVRYTYQYDGSLRRVGVTEHPSPDGGIESTVSDIQTFYRELFYGDKLLDRENEFVRASFAMDGDHWRAYGGGLGISSAVEVNLADSMEIVVLANTDYVIAERISQRILEFAKTGQYDDILDLEANFAYGFYKNQGKEKFYQQFKEEYSERGYTQFIGRTLNDLGMQLLRTETWNDALDIFQYLAYLYPKAPQPYDSIAFAFYSMGNKDKAKEVFKKALELNADFNSDYVSNNYGS